MSESVDKCPTEAKVKSYLLVLFNKQSNTKKYYIYRDVKQRKSATNLRLGSWNSKCLAFLLDK